MVINFTLHFRSSITREESSRKMEQHWADKFPLGFLMENILLAWSWSRKLLGLSCISTFVCCVWWWYTWYSTSPKTHSSLTCSTSCWLAFVSRDEGTYWEKGTSYDWPEVKWNLLKLREYVQISVGNWTCVIFCWFRIGTCLLSLVTISDIDDTFFWFNRSQTHSNVW